MEKTRGYPIRSHRRIGRENDGTRMDRSIWEIIQKIVMEVSLYSSICSFPFIFARHCWLVIEEDKMTERYEIFHFKNHNRNFGYMSINRFAPDSWIERIHGWNYGNWKWKFLGKFTKTTAKKIAKITRDSFYNYKNKHSYRIFPGPNSNTYIQWILDQVPECDLKLPWNAFGKKFPH